MRQLASIQTVLSCSTPFGITAVGSGRDRDPQHRGDVLNAFRHHGCREGPPRRARPAERAVLNAFRHHGCREVEAGQRAAVVESCSTPFGITAVGSDIDDGLLRPVEVLNAFRHHGCREVLASSRRSRRKAGAQRLSASRLSGVLPPLPVRVCVTRCSTPFGITAVGRPRGQPLHQLPRPVLNAFRHHGCREGPAPMPSGGTTPVLNAFRHHGCREIAGRRSATHAEKCSTPFGITAVGR